MRNQTLDVKGDHAFSAIADEGKSIKSANDYLTYLSFCAQLYMKCYMKLTGIAVLQ